MLYNGSNYTQLGNVGIGRKSPSGSVKLHTYSNNAINGNNIWHVADDGPLKLQLTSYSSNSNGLIEFRDAGGTELNPTATQAGDIIGQILANGRDASASGSVRTTRQNGFSRLGDGNASIKFEATGAFTAASTPTQISFYTTPSNLDTAKLGLRILSNGDVTTRGNIWANGNFYQSDLRLKENISTLNHGLSTILKIKTYRYNFIADNSKRDRFGVIAQEIQQVLPELVQQSEDADKTLGVNYAELIPILINSIQELQKEVELLKKKNK